MISNQIIREALYRLKRTGKRHIYISEPSKSYIDKINVGNNTINVSQTVVGNNKNNNLDALNKFNSIQLTKDTKSENIILLKDFLSSLYPNDKLLFGSGSLNPKIVFLSEYPSVEEFQNNSLCVGKANLLMEKSLKRWVLIKRMFTLLLLLNPRFCPVHLYKMKKILMNLIELIYSLSI